MNSPSRLNGMSSLSMLVVLLVAVFFITCAVKLTPVYLAGWSVSSVIDGAINDGKFNGKSPSEIRSVIVKYFSTNRVEAINAKDVKITRSDKNGKIEIDASYEQRVPLMYNIDVVIKFDDLKYQVPLAGSEQ